MPLSLPNSQKLLKIGLLVISLLIRIWLILSLPIWHDEAYSIWASEFPFKSIILGFTDYVHPPGYYILIKLLGIISSQLIWYRLSSLIFFVINFFLIDLIGQKIKEKKFSLILLFLYCFSGYFIVFDWQVRMYSGVLTLILASIWFLLTKRIYLFTLINALGLYFDYGFYWYFLPLLGFYTFRRFFKKDQECQKYILSWLISLSSLLLIFPFVLIDWPRAVKGITWAKPFVNPVVFMQYFFGTYNNNYLGIFSLVQVLIGVSLMIVYDGKEKITKILLWVPVASLATAFIYSVLISPIVHTRSMQIVGFTVIWAMAVLIYKLYEKKLYIVIIPIFVAFYINFWLVINLIFYAPGQVLISPIYWQQYLNDFKKYNSLVIQKPPKSQTPIIYWSLKYFLDGKEQSNSQKFIYKEIPTESSAPQNCQLIPLTTIDAKAYGCK